MVCILFIPALQDAFRLTGLTWTLWLTVMGPSAMSIVQMEAVKWLKRRKRAAVQA